MKIAFCLFKYFPYGGLQRDFYRIAQACHNRGHTIDVYTMNWQGEIPEWMQVHLIKTHGFSNHARAKKFTAQAQQILTKISYDRIIGFNKMPGLDVYFAADGCFVTKPQYRHFWSRLSRRYRTYAQLEKVVFAPTSKTRILLISAMEKANYQQAYQTPATRLTLLPPGIDKSRYAPSNAAEIRATVRKQFQISNDQYLLIMIGSSFHTKGLDRCLSALSSQPQSINYQFLVAGQDDPKPYVGLIKKLKLTDKVKFLGGYDGVSNLLLAADLLVHPARIENTGTVLLEAVVAGLPILATACCGYASYITAAQAGLLIPTPFEQDQMNALLTEMLDRSKLSQWQQNALTYAQTADLSSMVDKAADIICNP